MGGTDAPTTGRGRDFNSLFSRPPPHPQFRTFEVYRRLSVSVPFSKDRATKDRALSVSLWG